MPTVSGVPIIGGITFNFTESGYASPTWSGSVYSFGEVFGTLNQIYSDDYYVYAATNRGLSVVSMSAEREIGYIGYNTGFTTVWASDNEVYLGTTQSGIKYISKTCISGTTNNPADLNTCLNDFNNITPYHNLTSDNIRYIHGNNDLLMCCTNLGVDVIKAEPQGYRSSTTISGTQKCFITQNGLYYTISGTDNWSLNRVDYCGSDWVEPDFSYVTGSGILPAGEKINDIFITENTSENGIDNTVFCATSSGTYVIDEGNLNYEAYCTSSGCNTVFGTDDDFIAVWADLAASLTNGKFYVSSKNAFSVVDNSTKTLVDRYDKNTFGVTNEKLKDGEVVDINVV